MGHDWGPLNKAGCSVRADGLLQGPGGATRHLTATAHQPWPSRCSPLVRPGHCWQAMNRRWHACGAYGVKEGTAPVWPLLCHGHWQSQKSMRRVDAGWNPGNGENGAPLDPWEGLPEAQRAAGPARTEEPGAIGLRLIIHAPQRRCCPPLHVRTHIEGTLPARTWQGAKHDANATHNGKFSKGSHGHALGATKHAQSHGALTPARDPYTSRLPLPCIHIAKLLNALQWR